MFWCIGCQEFHWFNDSWNLTGTDEKPTVQPSILVSMPPTDYRCHSFITNGQIKYLDDCSHDRAGETVNMIDIED